MFSNFACFSVFGAYFDDITIKRSEGVITSLSSLSEGPYFSLELDQTSVSATRPSSLTIPLQINWLEGHAAVPVIVDVIDVNATGISSSASSTGSLLSSQLFDIVFDIPSEVQVGEYLFLISVKEIESDDTVDVAMMLNVQ